MGRIVLVVALLAAYMASSAIAFSQTVSSAATNEIRIVEIQGAVQVFSTEAKNWQTAQPNEVLHPFDRIQTAADSRVALRWSDQSIVPFGASTELEILPPGAADDQSGLHLIRGVLSFFHRDLPGHIRIITRGAVAGVEGTEFVLAVNDADVTTMSVVEGKVRLGNEHATLLLTNGQQAVVELGKAPVRTTGFIANNLLQWCFYYPAVLDLDDLPLTTTEQNDLAASLAAYRSGDLPAALAHYPDGQSNPSDSERIYHAALLLSVGEVPKAETILSSVGTKTDRTLRLANALRQLIAAVKRQPSAATGPLQLSSEFLAESYFEQSRALPETSLRHALALAQKAAALSPRSGFAWERVAELEFSFGRTGPAMSALDQSLALSPRNAQALALKGFILLSQDRPRRALDSFTAALAVDSALGNAWLGRGIARIRLHDNSGGREDLLVAAALEPQRAEFRSYLGKAYANDGDYTRANNELDLAKKLDPHDPTAWLYSAILKQEGNEINDAVRDLEKSEALNDNRSVYRSQLLLDEDSSVRAANLAGVYRDDGMLDLSLREAQRAVSTDYANYSAHLFLANSYDQLRDPYWSNLRYETPATAEYYIANLLAPGSVGTLSSIVSQPANVRLFDQNHVGVISDTTYLGRGAWTESGAQFGVYDNISYDFEALYSSDPGQRPDNYDEHRDLILTVKDQFTPQDSIFGSVEQDKITSGDVNEYYDPSQANTDFKDSQTQQPNLYLGYHHEWSPGVQTLFLATRRAGYESASSPDAGQLIVNAVPGYYSSVSVIGNGEIVDISTEENSAELQQIWETASHTTIVGAHYDWGQVSYENLQFNTQNSGVEDAIFPNPYFLSTNNFGMDYHHFSVYGYHTWQIIDPLSVTAGVTYDWLHEPADVATTPFVDQEKTTVQFSPKAGLIYTPLTHTTFRAAYTRSLSGLADNQSYRLEPTEVAGFNQAFRSIIPESAVGDTSGSRFDTIDLSLEQKFDTGTYLALSGEILYSKLRELQGAFVFFANPDGPGPGPGQSLGLNQSLNYRERTLTFTADQLLGKQWSAGAVYSVSQADLGVDYPDLPANIKSIPKGAFESSQSLESMLQTVTLHANWNHPSGLFSSLEADWYHQNNYGFSSAEPGDDFWQLNAYAGYRFWHRRAEITLGLLNLTDQNYNLEPLNFYNEMAHGRTFLARLLISF